MAHESFPFILKTGEAVPPLRFGWEMVFRKIFALERKGRYVTVINSSWLIDFFLLVK